MTENLYKLSEEQLDLVLSALLHADSYGTAERDTRREMVMAVRAELQKQQTAHEEARAAQSQQSVRRWKEGETRCFAGTDLRQPVFAGLFWYHGFGGGEYFSADGALLNISTSESQDLARAASSTTGP